MIRDIPTGLLAAVTAINQQSRKAFVEEQQQLAAKKPKLPGVPAPKADPAAHSGAAGMAKANMKEEAEQIDELSKKTVGSYIKAASVDAAHKAALAVAARDKGYSKDSEEYHGKQHKRVKGIFKATDRLTKEEVVAEAEGSTPRNEREKKLAAMHGDKTKITHGDVLKARGVVREGIMDKIKQVGKKVADTVGHKDDKDLIKDLQKKAGVPQTGKKPMKEEQEPMLEDFTIEELIEFMDTEDYQQLDELSRGTLVSYVNKVSKLKGARAGEHQGGLQRAAKKISAKKKMSEETQIDEALRTISKHGEGTGEHHAVVKRDAEWNEYQVHYYKNGKHMGEGPVSHHDDKEDAQSTAEHEVKRMNTKKEEVEQIDELSQEKLTSYMRGARKEMRKISSAGTPAQGSERRAKLDKRVAGYRKAWSKSEMKNENLDTPGNSTHQCAIHVKSEQYGEGKTLFSQHAAPDAEGNIAWYDVMFAEGIKRVETKDIEILVSESHMNHKKKAKK